MSADRREFLCLAASAAAVSGLPAAFPSSIARALAIPPNRASGSIKDVENIVILMMENRSFDHYFGTLRGVRGFGDPHPIPAPGGGNVWRQQSDNGILSPFHLDTEKTNALYTPGTPHSFSDSQAAWGQGLLNEWPRHKTDFAMGYYKRDDIPFQFALAEAFTICDAYHCSVTSGTIPNRIAFWSGSNFDPLARARGVNSTPDNSEPDNKRCWIEGALPEPGYTYHGNALTWPTIPDVLERAGVSWRIYQDPNNNWDGAMHGCLAFESFRNAEPGSPIYERGMRHWSLDRLAEEAGVGKLPQVSWILPPALWSEHPYASTPAQGAEFVARVLDSLTANPETWSRTMLLVTFDENDGLFDHAPPPAPPSYDMDGDVAGGSTFDLEGHYFEDVNRAHIDESDTLSGITRPWGLGPRVPAYVISPWSTGGWVCSEVFDHTSIGQFLEKRFEIAIPAISPWHRLVCGDLLSTLDFKEPRNTTIPSLPDASGSSEALLQAIQRPLVRAPETSSLPVQETGMRPSKALPYILHTDILFTDSSVRLVFRNEGAAGAVFHVYDRRRLDRLPRRYTIEPATRMADDWMIEGHDGLYDLQVFGPGGFMRRFSGRLPSAGETPKVSLAYLPRGHAVEFSLNNRNAVTAVFEIRANAYRKDGPWRLSAGPRRCESQRLSLMSSRNWYDFTVAGEGLEHRFAGRLETGADGVSDPAMGGRARDEA